MKKLVLKLYNGCIRTPVDKLSTTFIKHPIFGGIVVTVTYLMLDYYLVGEKYEDIMEIAYIGLIVALFFLVVGYIYPSIKQNNSAKEPVKREMLLNPTNRQHLLIFGLLTVLTVVFSVGYTVSIGLVLPDYTVHRALTIILIAPIMEELTYRRLLYGKWAKLRLGIVKGMLLIGLLFIITHPITSWVSFGLYWVPTILFFVIYENYGLYPSIIAHILFNIVALL